ncbi:FAD-binding and (Fe-S)-binding domain-containing protein [Nocardioides astragali]|uniref:FAD-binding and (Fe-S)-binding domain-containing protein n=1 Tax=Nocardioides astragali TaxID=1776736 RepID=A0ABW2N0I2_9ACTN|nr:FAD-binding and (Fe-S)-binding domain-containing protein [Nocardioides astragali]
MAETLGERGDTVGALAQMRRDGVVVDDSSLTGSLYSSDASVYRLVPAGVAFPRTADEVETIVRACRDHDVPLTSRGAGTSIAGNAIGTGIIIDHSKHLNSVLSIDTEQRSARVQPGVAHATLQRHAAVHDLRFGPDPSSHTRCTIGGMIGNNACGSRALGYGRTSDNVRGLHVLTASGEHIRTGTLASPEHSNSRTLDELRDTVAGSLATIRTEFGQFGRQVSGYSLEHLLPENGFDVTKALVGTEGTLGVILEADVRLVRDAPHRVMIVLGFTDMIAAAHAVPHILPFSPIACEGLDRRITDVVAATRGPAAVPELPAGGGWLFVELAGDNLDELLASAGAVRAASGALDGRLVRLPAENAALWKIREDGSGLVARTPSGRPAHAGWEDAAVPPSRLAAYLTEFEALLRSYRFHGVPYGHFGDGCVHVRIDFDLDDDSGRQRFRDFLGDAARLVAAHGGSISGEHGDGRARGDLLQYMYSKDAIDLFREVKRVFDPTSLLNPGVIVEPAAATADVRYTTPSTKPRTLEFLYPHDAQDLFGAVHRCTGVGRCVAPNPGNGVMCPSFQATHDEKDSTRGRARVLQDAMAGHLGPDGLRSPEVHEALDLCLACKGCKSDCPTGVDMATYKSEVLHKKYRRRLRPRSHYSLGRLPTWLKLAHHVPWLFNRVGNADMLRKPLAWTAGIDSRRDIPQIATRARRKHWRSSVVGAADSVSRIGATSTEPDKSVVLFVDTFTDNFSPQIAEAIIEVLTDAGYRVHLPTRSLCCGLTWISTGQLDGARRQLERTMHGLLPYVSGGMKVVGIEPSCTATLRSDLTELVDSPEALLVAESVVTLAELLTADSDYLPPDLSAVEVLAQPHCHHHAVMGWDTDRALLERGGARVRTVGGCCGLAGNFGAERGHYDISLAVAETQLLPALRDASADTVFLADGFSCRTQLEAVSTTRGLHLAEVLRRGEPAGL